MRGATHDSVLFQSITKHLEKKYKRATGNHLLACARVWITITHII
jgi:hypothetical protein